MNPKDMTTDQIIGEIKAIREGCSVHGDGGTGREASLKSELFRRIWNDCLERHRKLGGYPA